MTVLADSNRAVLKTAGPPSLSPDTLFTPGGCQRTLADGRELSWYADGQLAGVSSVVRSGREDDRERYQYAQAGERVRKVSSVLVSGGEQRTVVTYAGGMERRQRSTAGRAYTLDVSITESGGVRLIEDYAGGKHYVRYTLSDMLGSVMGETDEDGLVTAWEEYYPYGGSAGSDEEGSEVMDRTRRFSGKERDATGLYYYGHRYYQPGLCRWLSADPGGTIDGVNLYRMVRNNPTTLWDPDGLAPGINTIRKEIKSILGDIDKIIMTDLDLLKNNHKAVDETMIVLFCDDSNARKNEWERDLKQLHQLVRRLDVDRNISKMTNEELVEYGSKKPIAIADSDEYARYNKYFSAIDNLNKNKEFIPSGDFKKQLNEKKKDYSDERNAKFFRVNKGEWGKLEKSEWQITHITIHELSHLAVNTEGYAYGDSALSGAALLPIYQLSKGELPEAKRSKGFDKIQTYTPEILKDISYKNADTFAHATILLSYAASKNHGKLEKYKSLISKKSSENYLN
ncbi:RHS repeat-associated core domain-containing protein [Serratia sp. FS14]|uniref:RHS repeat-associated core domain-containing protein n=1 Tax=Serratia sp. (strain FS14) TaxID=1327989 RepID=UPI00130DC68A|nr:RHS repeat-associated core domain-containing protein [Serratia sp. FS14]